MRENSAESTEGPIGDRAAMLVATGILAGYAASCCAVGSIFTYVAPGFVDLGRDLAKGAFGASLVLSLGLVVVIGCFGAIAIERRHGPTADPAATSGERRSVAARIREGGATLAVLGVALTLFFWFPLFSVASVVNARTLGSPRQVACTVTGCARRQCRLACRTSWGGDITDRQARLDWLPPVGSRFRAVAREGALGTWLLDTRSVRVEGRERRP